MPRPQDRPLPPEGAALAFARAAAFFATVTVVAVLALLGSAQAAILAPPASLAAPGVAEADEWEDFDEGEEEADAGEEAEEEETGWCLDLEAWTGEPCEEEGEGEGDEKAAEERGSPATAEDCVLLDASAAVRAADAPGRVRLTLRYEARSPTAVTVAYRLRGGRGSLHLGTDRERFGRAGAFRDTELLPERRMAKVAAARQFTVSVRAVNSPPRCAIERRLTVRRSLPGGLLWAERSARPARR